VGSNGNLVQWYDRQGNGGTAGDCQRDAKGTTGKSGIGESFRWAIQVRASLTDPEAFHAMSSNLPEIKKPLPDNFAKYFKIGVSKDFILIRDDFPMAEITPGEFSRLCLEMFAKNDEVCHGK
jgi:hypothetical protein